MARCCLLLLVLTLVSGCGSSERANYVRANGKLFKELPRFPGSELTKHYSTGYSGESDISPVLGYTSVYELKLPAGV